MHWLVETFEQTCDLKKKKKPKDDCRSVFWICLGQPIGVPIHTNKLLHFGNGQDFLDTKAIINSLSVPELIITNVICVIYSWKQVYIGFLCQQYQTHDTPDV